MISDEEDQYRQEEDESNKAQEISRIEQEVLKRQREIELLLAKKNQEQQALAESRELHTDIQHEKEEKARQRKEEAAREFKVYEKKLAKKHILNRSAGFADSLASIHHMEKVMNQQKTEFFKARKYAFGLEEETVLVTSIEVDEKEKYSGQQLNKRYIDSESVDHILTSKTVLRVDKLFAKVCPPDYKEPNYPNWVVIGVVTAKEELETRGKSGRQSKYTRLTISDFMLSVSLLLFDLAHKSYYKLQVGDVIGILNPKVGVKRNNFNGSLNGFYLSLSVSDSIVEIGRSKNFAICKGSKRGTGSNCKIPVDKSKSEYCEYHQNISLKKITANRLELGGLSTSGGLNKSRNAVDEKTILMNKNYKSSDTKSYGIQIYDNHYASQFNTQDDLNTGRIYFSNVNAKKAFFDDEYINPDAVANLESKKKKLRNQKKELELRQKLASIKGGESLKNDLTDKKFSSKEIKQNIGILQAAYGPGTINELGFDPTKKAEGSQGPAQLTMANLSDQRGRAKKKIEVLDKIRKRKKKHLSPSRDAKSKRSKTWNENYHKTKKYEKDVQAKEDYEMYLSEELSSAPSSAFASPLKDAEKAQNLNVDLSAKKNLKNMMYQSESSDSELEINFDEKDKEKSYYAAISKN